ncbi:integumentary mucin C.1-like, partial [Musca vetustissima]|uniref:integumentary mucin C.1-like n=1 Tax=Musca vetustissima TaxID=27455 RepID=UPI002AB737DA
MSSEPAVTAGGQIITTTQANIMASSQLETTAPTVGPQEKLVNIVGTTMTSIKETVKTLITTPTATTTTTTATSTSSMTTPTTSTSTTGFPSSSASLAAIDPTKQSVADLSTSLQHFGIVDYCVFVLMLIICAAIGFYFGFIEKKQKKGKGQKGTEQRRGSEALDYLVGGRKMKVFPVSLSLVARY